MLVINIRQLFFFRCFFLRNGASKSQLETVRQLFFMCRTCSYDRHNIVFLPCYFLLFRDFINLISSVLTVDLNLFCLFIYSLMLLTKLSSNQTYFLVLLTFINNFMNHLSIHCPYFLSS